MKLIDKVISTLETIVEYEHEALMRCIPAPGEIADSAVEARAGDLWLSNTLFSAERYKNYRNALATVKETGTLQGIDRNIRDQIITHIIDTEA